MNDITTMDQLPTKRPIGRPKKYITDVERLEIKRANDRKYYSQNSEAKINKVKEYQSAHKEYILQRNEFDGQPCEKHCEKVGERPCEKRCQSPEIGQ